MLQYDMLICITCRQITAISADNSTADESLVLAGKIMIRFTKNGDSSIHYLEVDGGEALHAASVPLGLAPLGHDQLLLDGPGWLFSGVVRFHGSNDNI